LLLLAALVLLPRIGLGAPLVGLIDLLTGARPRQHPSANAAYQPPPLPAAAPAQPASAPPSVASEDTLAKVLCDVVDAVDSVSALLERSPSGRTRDEFANIRDTLLNIVRKNNGQLIDDDTYNPERQKPIAIRQISAPAGTSPRTRIVGKGSSGLTLKGIVRRKQEVSIEHETASSF
jgi:hypothetical protein